MHMFFARPTTRCAKGTAYRRQSRSLGMSPHAAAFAAAARAWAAYRRPIQKVEALLPSERSGLRPSPWSLLDLSSSDRTVCARTHSCTLKLIRVAPHTPNTSALIMMTVAVASLRHRPPSLGGGSSVCLLLQYLLQLFFVSARTNKRHHHQLFAWGEGGSGGHVLRETTSRGLCGLVCPSRTF